ncbi:protein S-acyltransferase 11-like [Coffea eugenioides]|uniref:protein S-acyltransferase 11-like n=1 Tax=Coffea eugenioides TaxID=49369 RepID=UPI000F6143E3|nr:protein S-acyltransferase 11-like [Coffea eugenioides]
MDFVGSPSPSSASTSAPNDVTSQEHYVTSIEADHETTCWGCGVRLLVSPHAPVFKCGWCGAITNRNALKNNNQYYKWRRLRDRCFVVFVLLFMLFIICGGIWAVYPVVFSISFFWGIFHSTITLILSVSTLSSFGLASFLSPGVPPRILWGSYPAVGKGGLENYTFCHHCSKPKSSRTHHCSSCGMCVLDMDHHCPFIGNCVGAANHRCFIIFLISAVMSTIYVSTISFYAALHVWPPVNYVANQPLNRLLSYEVTLNFLKESAFALLRSAVFLTPRGLVLVYLFIASVSVGIGLSVLLWQQLSYVYRGKTYLSQLNASEGDGGERDCKNLINFFGCQYIAARYFPSFWNSRKTHEK